MRKNLGKFLFVCIFIGIATQYVQKPIQNQISQMQTGSVELAIEDQSSDLQLKYQSYKLTLENSIKKNSQNIRYAFALKDVFLIESNINYFDLIVLKTLSCNLILSFLYQRGKWAKVAYNYWITSNEGIFLSLNIITGDRLEYFPSKNQYQAKASFGRSIKPSKNVLMVFLTGIKIQQEKNQNYSLSFAILSQSLDENFFTIWFSCGSSDKQKVKFLSISSVIFSPQQKQFASYGGILSKTNFKSQSFENLHYMFPEGNFFAFYGISKFESAASNATNQNGKVSYHSQIFGDSLMHFSVANWQLLQKLQISYIFFGNLPASLCMEKEAPYIYKNKCVSFCPSDTFQRTYIDGAKQCASCMENMTFSQNEKKCVCKEGFFSSNYQCFKAQQVKMNAISIEDNLLGQQQQILKLIQVKKNKKYIFVNIQTTNSAGTDEQFKYSCQFAKDSKPNSYYCTKKSDSKSKITCLLLYTTGIPKKSFKFSFFQKKSKLQIDVK